MCTLYFNPTYDLQYLNDFRRGRHSELMRFSRIEEYAYRRWKKTRDMRYAAHWIKVMESVRRRRP